jgi:hypothetical protein
MEIASRMLCHGPVDISALAAAIAAQDDAAWLEQVDRQKDYEVHRLTQSIVLLFAEVDPWPRMEVTRQPGWGRLSAVAVPLMDSIIARWYPAGGVIIRAMAAKLLPGGKIDPHRDSHPSFNCGHRIHVPITTNPRVRFTVDGRPFKLEVGQCYEINNRMMHSVANKGDTDRIHFIFDYVPANKLPVPPPPTA